MKTRRSPRNQMILWRELHPDPPKKPIKVSRKLPTKAEVIAARWRT